MLIPSVELPHVQLVSVGAVDDHLPVEDVLELDFVQASQAALEGFVMEEVQRKDDLSPGIRSGSARSCLSWRSIIGTALP